MKLARLALRPAAVGPTYDGLRSGPTSGGGSGGITPLAVEYAQRVERGLRLCAILNKDYSLGKGSTIRIGGYTGDDGKMTGGKMIRSNDEVVSLANYLALCGRPV